MMLLEKIKADQMVARKERNAEKAAALTTLFAEAANVGKNKANRDSTDDEVIGVVKKFIDNVNICLQHAKTEESKQTYLCELEWYKAYQPSQLSEAELRSVISAAMSENKNMGTIMAYLKQNFSGAYDGKMASTLIKEMLS